jgi:ribosomal protein S27AE
MSETSKYTLIKTERDFCPRCHEGVTLLSPEVLKLGKLPGFYICFKCGFVGEVGRGPVRQE